MEGGRVGSIRNIFFLFAFLFYFGFAIFGTVSAQDMGDYVGSESCKTCHSDIYKSWSNTDHSLERGCDECHSTRSPSDGATLMQGVQCEACHSAGANHVASGDKADIVINWSANLCGQCHRTSHFPYFEEWEESAHADSLLADDGSVIDDPECKGCHVSQAVVSRFEERACAVDTPEPVDCQTCHDPHGSPNEGQLRFPADELCAECHNTEGAEIGGAASHPQAEMLSGSIMHGAGITCYTCHKYIKVYESELSPRVTGHTFEPRPEQCATPECHPGKDVEWAKNAIDLDQYEIRKLLEEAEHELSILDSVLIKVYPDWDGSKGSIKDASEPTIEVVDKYLQAKHNIEFVKDDRSFGVHNRIKAEAKLKEVEPLVEESLEILRTQVRGASKVIPKEEPPGVCGPSAVLLFAMLPPAAIRLRKKR
jgi:predicted CXXCH cytochrome family protein